MGLDNVAPEEERHLTIRLDPYLVSRMLGKDGKRGDVQSKFAGLCELACRERLAKHPPC